ncbi:hypothetical protein F4859DRAFT_467390 [Xylaria cf. heliscus]|nr:hypothetical protein F4859DRAFT_467390 [Xylaria cf. heliscus]
MCLASPCSSTAMLLLSLYTILRNTAEANTSKSNITTSRRRLMRGSLSLSQQMDLKDDVAGILTKALPEGNLC